MINSILANLAQYENNPNRKTPDVLHSKQKAESIAAECSNDDFDWTYKVIPWGSYWVVEISEQEGLIGYL